MIKRIEKYEAKDGSQWNTFELAEKRELLLSKINAISLPKLDINGHQFYQHLPGDVLSVQSNLMKIIVSEVSGIHPSTIDMVLYATKPMYQYTILSRILNDVGGPLDTAWRRLGNIDDQFREWEQPYYTTHTPENPIELK